jgi:DNA polymerase-3 subunit alpha
MQFPGYFLIVADFIKWAKGHDIPVGPGRGSGAGSLVAWALTITDVDPLRFSLLFERFLNPDRVSMPDFDIDFCQDRREEVIRYVQERYGRDQVGQIITFGTLQARAVLRDVGRVLEMPYGQVDRLCKLVPNNPANPTPLGKAIEGEPKFEEEKEKEPIGRAPARHGAEAGRALPPRLDPRCRYRHRRPAAVAAGADVPRSALRHAGHPVQHEVGRAGRTGEVRLPRPEDADRAEDGGGSHRRRGIDIDLPNLPLDDAPTYEMLSRGETVGVFQVESAGMRKALIGMKPDRIEDIIALVALYRPGPMENIPTYNARKHGEEEIASIHPKIDHLCEGDAGRHRLPGAGDADRPGTGRLHARTGRFAPPRHGQEDPRRDGKAARHFRRGRVERGVSKPQATSSSTCSPSSPTTASTSRTPPPMPSSPIRPPI